MAAVRLDWPLPPVQLLILLVLCLGAVIIFELLRPIDLRWSSLGKYKLPPGPAGVPVLGNLGQYWKSQSNGEMENYLLSQRNFGEMTTLHMGSHLWILINSERVAEDIIDKRSTITSERPHMPIASGLVSGGKRSVLELSKTWAEVRRMMRPLAATNTIKSFAKWQDVESARMLLSYLEKPSEWYAHQARYSASVLHGVIAGHRLTKSEDELQEYRQVTMQFLGSILSTVVDFFPGLELLPKSLQFWRRKWEPIGRFHYRVFKDWWTAMKSYATSSDAGPSWVRDTILNPDMKFNGSEDEALYLTNSVISAGSDSTRRTLNVFVMACIAFPEEVQKCREEIDKACGPDAMRLPDLEDISSLRYTCAFIKECLRWRPIFPIIPPHKLTERLNYEGFVFPEGTNFVINTMAISADCESPDSFLPQRWLNGNETRLTHGFWGFGGGRRVCVGYKAVQPGLFFAISRLIFCFDFQANGEYDSKKLNHWKTTEPFPVQVKTRSEAHDHLIRNVATSKEPE